MATFSADGALILSKRVYWDQATVLRQISLLTSEVNKLPLSSAFPVHAQILPVLSASEMKNRFLNESILDTANPLLGKLDPQSRPPAFKPAAMVRTPNDEHVFIMIDALHYGRHGYQPSGSL
jgi:hypothetical protein